MLCCSFDYLLGDAVWHRRARSRLRLQSLPISQLFLKFREAHRLLALPRSIHGLSPGEDPSPHFLLPLLSSVGIFVHLDWREFSWRHQWHFPVEATNITRVDKCLIVPPPLFLPFQLSCICWAGTPGRVARRATKGHSARCTTRRYTRVQPERRHRWLTHADRHIIRLPVCCVGPAMRLCASKPERCRTVISFKSTKFWCMHGALSRMKKTTRRDW